MRPPAICHDCGQPIPRNSGCDVKRGTEKFTVCTSCRPARVAEARTLQRQAALRGHVTHPRKAPPLKAEPKKAQPSVCPGNEGGPHHWLLNADEGGRSLTQGSCRFCGATRAWAPAWQPNTVLAMRAA
jgi:hypothetical protein